MDNRPEQLTSLEEEDTQGLMNRLMRLDTAVSPEGIVDQQALEESIDIHQRIASRPLSEKLEYYLSTRKLYEISSSLGRREEAREFAMSGNYFRRFFLRGIPPQRMGMIILDG